jgi:hypothetical protein
VSAKGRGTVVEPNEDYSTPMWCARRFFEAWLPPPGVIVEPCVGEGNIVKAFGQSVHRIDPWDWVTYDIRNTRACDDFPGVDFLTSDETRDDVTAVITNPPFSKAEDFIRHCRLLYDYADIAMLLRLNFLGSAERADLWKDIGMPDLYVLPNRPSFVKGKSDSCEYAWMVWPRGNPRSIGSVRTLASTPLVERRFEMDFRDDDLTASPADGILLP